MTPEPFDNHESAAHQEQVLRDLNWAVTSASLIAAGPETAEQPETLDLSAIDVAHLKRFIAPYSKFRIGTYFEGLILYWLEQIRGLKILARHQQVFEDNKTIGEIDILFEDEAGELTHWEIAVKFYLYTAETNPTGSHFVGPNVKDTFEKKMRRLFAFQLPLSKTHFPEVTRRQAFVKGIIFYHPDQSPPDNLPQHLSPAHKRGLWLPLSNLHRLGERGSDQRYLIREKPDWLSPALLEEGDERLLSFEALQEQLETHFQKQSRPILITALNCQQSDCREVDRVFIVPESWPF